MHQPIILQSHPDVRPHGQLRGGAIHSTLVQLARSLPPRVPHPDCVLLVTRLPVECDGGAAVAGDGGGHPLAIGGIAGADVGGGAEERQVGGAAHL